MKGRKGDRRRLRATVRGVNDGKGMRCEEREGMDGMGEEGRGKGREGNIVSEA